MKRLQNNPNDEITVLKQLITNEKYIKEKISQNQKK